MTTSYRVSSESSGLSPLQALVSIFLSKVMLCSKWSLPRETGRIGVLFEEVYLCNPGEMTLSTLASRSLQCFTSRRKLDFHYEKKNGIRRDFLRRKRGRPQCNTTYGIAYVSTIVHCIKALLADANYMQSHRHHHTRVNSHQANRQNRSPSV